MAAMASKFNFECVIQYYTDQCSTAISNTYMHYTTYYDVISNHTLIPVNDLVRYAPVSYFSQFNQV